MVFVSLLLVEAPEHAVAQFTPVNIGHTNDGSGALIFAVGIAVSGNYAYTANYAGGLRIYDVSDPTHPSNVGYTNNGGYAWAVTTADNYAYLVGSSGFRVYDVSNPAKPASVGYTNFFNDGNQVLADGNYVYSLGTYDGLRIFDVSNPAMPVQIGRTTNGPYNYGFTLLGEYAYVAGSFYSGAPYTLNLRIYDLSNPANPIVVGAISNNNNIAFSDVAISGNKLFATSYNNTIDDLWVYDISNPTTPTNITHNLRGVPSERIVVSGDFAYLVGGNVRICDISNPTRPVTVGQTSSLFSAEDVAVSGNYIYVANSADGLRIYLLVPQLNARLTNTNTVLVSWPVPPVNNFVLQQNADLSSATWLDVTNTTAVVGNRNQVIISPSAASVFYRLKSP